LAEDGEADIANCLALIGCYEEVLTDVAAEYLFGHGAAVILCFPEAACSTVALGAV